MSELRTLGRLGDVKISWNRNNKQEVEAAKEAFDSKIKVGWSAFAEKGGCRGERITKFDADAERIVLVPQISGG